MPLQASKAVAATSPFSSFPIIHYPLSIEQLAFPPTPSGTRHTDTNVDNQQLTKARPDTCVGSIRHKAVTNQKSLASLSINPPPFPAAKCQRTGRHIVSPSCRATAQRRREPSAKAEAPFPPSSFLIHPSAFPHTTTLRWESKWRSATNLQ